MTRGPGPGGAGPRLMGIILRDYQLDAVAALYAHLAEREDNPVIEIPTGGGKTPIIAEICRDAVGWDSRVVVVAHVRELLTQSIAHLTRDAADLIPKIGVCSAGLGMRQTTQPIVVAGVQSAYRNPERLGHRDILIVDEAHRIPASGEGMYRVLIEGLRRTNPALRVIGMTATPFRTSTGPLCTSDGILNRVCYRIGVRELIVRGFLCPLISRAGHDKPDTSGLHIRVGEFVASEVSDLMDTDALVASACAEIKELTKDRRSVLVFCSGVVHAHRVAKKLNGAVVVGDTPALERDRIIAAFRSGAVKYLCNVDVLTLGFDAPGIDCIVMLRPTASPGLYYQMVGRGFRIAEGKENCIVLDYGGNVIRHGPVDTLKPGRKPGLDAVAPAKECPECAALVATGYAACPICGYEWPVREPGHGSRADGADILSGHVSRERFDVGDICYAIHSKRGALENAPKTMRVDYSISIMTWASEWICFEHKGYARRKAERWWRWRADTIVPQTAAEGVERSGELRRPTGITIRSVSGEKYSRITEYEWESHRLTEEEEYIPTIAEALAAAEDIDF